MFGLGKTARERRTLDQIEYLTRELASASGALASKWEELDTAGELVGARKQLAEAEIRLTKIQELHDKEKREIDHKLGLHRIQVEQERTAAVQEAKLAVREEALAAQEGRFRQEMEFMQTRFEDEVKSQRILVEQVLTRLPVFEHKRVEHIGVDPNPPQRLAIEE